MREAFLKGVQRAKREPAWRMQHRFLAFYTEMLVWSVSGPWTNGSPRFLATAPRKSDVYSQRGSDSFLRSLSEDQQKEWWNTWLRGYWENRLHGVPCPLDDEEIAQMLEWVVQLPGVFPEAVGLAVRMRKVPLERSMILHRISESGLIDEYPNDLANS